MELHLLLICVPLVGLVSLVYAHNGPSYTDFSIEDLPRLALIPGYLPHFTIFISMPGPLCLQFVSNTPFLQLL